MSDRFGSLVGRSPAARCTLEITIEKEAIPMTGLATQHIAQTDAEDWRTEPIGVGAPETSSRWEVSESLRAVRAGITQPGCYLIYEDFDGQPIVCAVDGDVIRVGRSLHADVRFEDPTVSRRHAMIIRQDDEVRVVDERSRNGVFLGGEQVSSSVLADGDDLTVGRHQILFVRVPSR
jgi:hypothetical protein